MPDPIDETPVTTPPKLTSKTQPPPSPREPRPASPSSFPPADWPTWSAIEPSASSSVKEFLETTTPTPRADSPNNHTSSSDNNSNNGNNNSPPSPRKRSQPNAQLLQQQKEKEQQREEMEQKREEEHARILGEDGGGGKFGVNEVFAAVRAGVDSERLVGRLMTWRAENEKGRIAKGSVDGKEGGGEGKEEKVSE